MTRRRLRWLLLSIALHALAIGGAWWAYREPVQVEKRREFDREWGRIMKEQAR